MATEVGKLYYDLSVKDNTSGQLDVADKKVQGFSSSLKAMGVVLAGAFSAQKIYEFGKATVTAGAQMEQWTVSFETMIGSADRANKLLADIRDFAKKTPFNQKDLIEGSKSLMAYGIEAEKILPTLNSLGNITAGVGKDKMPQLILALGQVRAAGKLTGMELRQFTEAGVPLLEELGKTMGKTASQVKADMENGLAPSFDIVEQSLANMSKEGGRFHNLMQKQSKTTAGRWSNLQDQIQIGMADIGQRLLPYINKGFDALPNILLRIRTTFSTLQPYLSTFVAVATTIGTTLATVLGPALSALWNVIENDVLPVVMRLWNALDPGLMIALGAIAAIIGGTFLAGLWIGINALKIVIAVLSDVIGWISNLIGWLGTAGGVVYNFSRRVIGWFGDIPSRVMGFVNSIVDFIKSIPTRIGDIGGKLFDAIGAPFKFVFNKIAGFWNSTVGKLSFKAPDWVPGLGGKGWEVPDIPQLAKGGIVTRPTLAMIGEDGAEAVVPLNKKNNPQGIGLGGGNITINLSGIMTESREGTRQVARSLVNALNEQLRAQNKQEIPV